MKKYTNFIAGAFLVLLLGTTNSFAEGETNIFGFFQGRLSRYSGIPEKTTEDLPQVENLNTGIQQANIFITKSTEWGLTGFLNLEFTNNFSSNKQWGYFNLQEAFIKYDFADELSVKAGLLTPKFNAMYEIYNRTPLLPYISRPLMYETEFGQVTEIFNILPARALVQVSGSVSIEDFYLVSVEDFYFDYAAYLGNAPDTYIESPENEFHPDYLGYGQNGTIFSTIGGRLGIRFPGISVGVSGVIDKSNKRNFEIVEDERKEFGDLDRMRIGGDLSIKVAPVTITAEVLIAKTDLTAEQKDSLKVWAEVPNAYVGKDFDVSAFFVTALVDVTDEFFVYGTYDKFQDNARPFFVGIDGMTGASGGAGYRFGSDLVLKAQYKKNYSEYKTDVGDVGLNDHYYLLGFSYSF